MTAAAEMWGTSIARHPKLAESLNKAKERGWPTYPAPVLRSFLGRLEHRYPGMQLDGLRPWRMGNVLGEVTTELSLVRFTWTRELLLKAGLVPPEALPPGRTRIHSAECPALRLDERIHCRARRGGTLEVCVRVPDCVAADHPLAFFRARSVREGWARPILWLAVDNTREMRQ